MAISKLSKADIKTIMQLNQMTAHMAWTHGHKAGDEGADRNVNPFSIDKPVDENLVKLMQKALGSI